MRLWNTFQRKVQQGKINIGFYIYQKGRRLLTRHNSYQVTANRNRLGSPLKVAVDTNVLQLFSKKMVGFKSDLKYCSERDTFFDVFGGSEIAANADQLETLEYCFTICEAFRNGDLIPITLSSVNKEQSEAPDRHFSRYHGPDRLDYDVVYQDYDFFSVVDEIGYLFKRTNVDEKNISSETLPIESKYLPMIKQLGDKPNRDSIHLIACDIGRVDVFLTNERRLTNVYRQYQRRTNVYQPQLNVMRPKEFCETLGIKKIKIPIVEGRARSQPQNW